MKKQAFIILVTFLVMLVAVTTVVAQSVVKGFDPYMIPVDKDNLPSEVASEDLAGDFLSAHKLEEISSREGKDIVVGGTDGNIFTGKPNMVLHSQEDEDIAEDEKEPEKEPEEDEEDGEDVEEVDEEEEQE